MGRLPGACHIHRGHAKGNMTLNLTLNKLIPHNPLPSPPITTPNWSMDDLGRSEALRSDRNDVSLAAVRSTAGSQAEPL